MKLRYNEVIHNRQIIANSKIIILGAMTWLFYNTEKHRDIDGGVITKLKTVILNKARGNEQLDLHSILKISDQNLQNRVILLNFVDWLI